MTRFQRCAFPCSLLLVGILAGHFLHLPDAVAARRSQAGGLPAANARIDRLKAQVDAVSQDILALQETVLMLVSAVDSLDQDVAGLSQAVEANSNAIELLDERLTAVEGFLVAGPPSDMGDGGDAGNGSDSGNGSDGIPPEAASR